MNNITQISQENCIASEVSSANNNVVILDGTTIDGNFTGVQQLAASDATCIITSSMDSTVSNVIATLIQQTNKSQSDIFGDFSFNKTNNSFDLSNSIVNNITQLNQITCAANTTASANNNYIYARDSKVGGNYIGVSTDSKADANCNISNTMKNAVYNQVQSTVNQNNTIQGMFVAMVAAFAGVVGAIVLVVVILFFSGKLSFSASDQDEADQNLAPEPNFPSREPTQYRVDAPSTAF